jgi:hypothetical protein
MPTLETLQDEIRNSGCLYKDIAAEASVHPWVITRIMAGTYQRYEGIRAVWLALGRLSKKVALSSEMG